VFAWVSPLLVLSWLSLAFLDPNPPGRDIVWIGYFLGSLFAHSTLAAAWVAFGPGRFVWRFPLSIAWALSLPLAVGICLGVHGGPDDAIVVVGGCLLGQWLALQVPLGALARGFGLHLRQGDDGEGGAKVRQLRFGIRHLLLVMLIVGVILGMGRIAISNISFSGSREAPIFVFLATAAFVLTLPLLLAALMRRNAILGVLLALSFIGVTTALEFPLLKSLGGSGPEIGHFISINTTSAGLILVIAFVVRLNGYCLHARDRKAGKVL
jgi:hypothetical protein